MQIPKQSIEWLVAKLHVSVSDEEVARDMRRRLADAPITTPRGTAAFENRVVAYALKCLHENQGLYRRIVSGRL